LFLKFVFLGPASLFLEVPVATSLIFVAFFFFFLWEKVSPPFFFGKVPSVLDKLASFVSFFAEPGELFFVVSHTFGWPLTVR